MINLASALPIDLVLFFVATLLGAIVAGVAGFAFGLIASAIWLHIIPANQSAPLIAAFAILIQGATLWQFRYAMSAGRSFSSASTVWCSPSFPPSRAGALLTGSLV